MCGPTRFLYSTCSVCRSPRARFQTQYIMVHWQWPKLRTCSSCESSRLCAFPGDCCLWRWRRMFFGANIVSLLTLQFAVSSQVTNLNDHVFTLFGGQRARLHHFRPCPSVPILRAAARPCL